MDNKLVLTLVGLGGLALWTLTKSRETTKSTPLGVSSNTPGMASTNDIFTSLAPSTLLPVTPGDVWTIQSGPRTYDALNQFALDALEPIEVTLVNKLWSRLEPYRPKIREVALKNGVPTTLIYATIFVESSINPSAKTWEPTAKPPDYSYGLGAVLPATADWNGYRGPGDGLLNPDTNLEVVATYLGKQLVRYNNDIPSAISSYNAGTAFRSTSGAFNNQDYVNKVSRYFDLFNRVTYKTATEVA